MLREEDGGSCPERFAGRCEGGKEAAGGSSVGNRKGS